jgi:hypothetical protein
MPTQARAVFGQVARQAEPEKEEDPEAVAAH